MTKSNDEGALAEAVLEEAPQIEDSLMPDTPNSLQDLMKFANPELEDSTEEAKEPEPKTDPEPKETAEPEKAPELSSYLLQTAVSLGVPENLARSYKDDAALHAALQPLLVNRGVPPAPTAPVQTAPVQEKATEGFKRFEFDASKLVDDENDLDGNKIVEAIGRMNDHYAAQAELTQKNMNQLALDTQRMQFETQRSQFDAYVATQGDEWKDVLGSGPSRKLGHGSEQFKNRNAMYLAAHKEEATYRQHGITPPSMEELYERARNTTFQSKVAEIARAELDVKVTEQKKIATDRPSARRPRASKPEDRLREATEHMQVGGAKIGLWGSLQ